MTERRCPVCAALRRNERLIAQADEAARDALGKRAEDPMAPRPSDGRYFNLTPASVSSEMPGDQD